MGTSNTGQSRKAGTFTKGDPRINRKGRPKSFDALRELAQQIAAEPAREDDGEPVFYNGRPVSVVERILRNWAGGHNRVAQLGFLEIAFGKVPTKVDVTSDGERLDVLTIQVIPPLDVDPAD